MASSFKTVMAAKLGIVDEFIYLWDRLLYLVMLDSLCKAVGWGPLVELTVRSIGVAVLSVLQFLNPYIYLDFEGKHQLRVFGLLLQKRW